MGIQVYIIYIYIYIYIYNKLSLCPTDKASYTQSVGHGFEPRMDH